MQITLQLCPGDDFDTISNIAYRLALREHHTVDFKFNGVRVMMIPWDDHKNIEIPPLGRKGMVGGIE